MNPRLLRRLFDAASSTAKRVIKNNLDTAIQEGKFNVRIANADDVLNALGRGALNSIELGHVVKALINSGDITLTRGIADALTQNSSFTSKLLEGFTEKEARVRLSQIGFENGPIDEVINSWKSNGNSFRTVFSDGVINAFKNTLAKSANVQRIKSMAFLFRNVEKQVDDTLRRMAAKVKTQPLDVDLTQEISNLTALATAAKKSHQRDVKQILENFIDSANIPNEQKRQIKNNLRNNTYYNDWLELTKGLDNVHFKDYLKAYGKLSPVKYVNGKRTWNKEFFNSMGNFIVYANPMSRKEMQQQMMKYGVLRSTAQMLSARVIRTLVLAPLAISTWEMIKGLWVGDDVSWKEDFADAAWDNLGRPKLERWTNIDEFYHVFTSPRSELLDEFYGTDQYSEEDIIRMLNGTYTESEGEETSSTSKERAVRNYLNRLYRNDSSSEEYISRVNVVSGNQVVYRQKTSNGFPKNIPMTIYNGKIYLVNKEIGKMIEFSNLWN